jgi:hypothetical protein
VTEELTGVFDLAGIPLRAREAFTASYTDAFDRAVIVSAAMAALGGLLAAATIRDRSS